MTGPFADVAFDDRDVDDTVRVILDLGEVGVIDRETRQVLVAELRAHKYLPQAVMQAVMSFTINHRHRDIVQPISYIRRAVQIQHERLTGETP